MSDGQENLENASQSLLNKNNLKTFQADIGGILENSQLHANFTGSDKKEIV